MIAIFELHEEIISELKTGVQSQEPVMGLTHSFYRYPARFSPLFARAAIKAFTKPGDIVFDPFMGGGTTLVEAYSMGRKAYGCDINSLAVFISQVKTTSLTNIDIKQINEWADNLKPKINLRNKPIRATDWIELGYQKHINNKLTWRIRKTLELALASLSDLPKKKQQEFARCVLLKTTQWALDSRIHIPTIEDFRKQFFTYLEEMIEGVKQYSSSIKVNNKQHDLRNFLKDRCIQRPAIGIESDWRLRNIPVPKLILTSPPYPGVHVLYHRWQVQGRRETPAPYWIANCLDGNGEAFYTFGSRKQQNLTSYFEQTKSAYSSIAKVSDHNTVLVQMIAFSDPSWQLEKYLSTLEEAGFSEFKLPCFPDSPDGRLWRIVPNRKWYANQKGLLGSSQEVVLFHRLL